MLYANGDEYTGELKDGKHEGWGELKPNNGGEYEGLFKNEKLEGAVEYQKDDSSAYEYFIFENNIRGEPSTQDEWKRQKEEYEKEKKEYEKEKKEREEAKNKDTDKWSIQWRVVEELDQAIKALDLMTHWLSLQRLIWQSTLYELINYSKWYLTRKNWTP